jgi:hypothetical protein
VYSMGEKAVRAMLPVLLGAVFLLTAETAMDALTDLARATPRVGDILAFTPSPAVPAEQNPRFVVHRSDASGCVLDLDAMRQTGGSLVVESELATEENGFRVHWAGERTTTGAGNCGTSADLIVNARELKILSLGAGYAPIAVNDLAN